MLARLLENPFEIPGLNQHRSCATLLLPQEVFAWLCLRGCCRKQQWEKGNFCEWIGAELAEVLGDISSSQGAQLGLPVSPLQVWVLQLCVPPPGCDNHGHHIYPSLFYDLWFPKKSFWQILFWPFIAAAQNLVWTTITVKTN